MLALEKMGFVFARGGSKGIPGKNLVELDGVTLLEKSLRDLEKIGIDKTNIFCSSDSEEILEVACDEGVVCIERPLELATDASSEFLSWQHAVSFVKKSKAFNNFIFVSAPTTCPFRNSSDLLALVESYEKKMSGLHFGVLNARRNPHFNMYRSDEQSRLSVACPLGYIVDNRQQAPNYVDGTTCGYVTSAQEIMDATNLTDLVFYGTQVSSLCSLDLDTFDDLRLAELIAKALKHG